MKKSKFSETQIVSILKQGDAGVPAPRVRVVVASIEPRQRGR